jgi:hypothetical protein
MPIILYIYIRVFILINQYCTGFFVTHYSEEEKPSTKIYHHSAYTKNLYFETRLA